MRGDRTNSASQRRQVHLTLQAPRGGTFLTSVELTAGGRKDTDGFVPALPGEIPSAGTSRQGQGRDPRLQDALPLRPGEDRPTGKQSTLVALADAPQPRPSLGSHVIRSPPQGPCTVGSQLEAGPESSGTAARQGQAPGDFAQATSGCSRLGGPGLLLCAPPAPGAGTRAPTVSRCSEARVSSGMCAVEAGAARPGPC